MLMIPPALATKSGVQRMPRACSCVGDRVGGELVVRRAGDRAAAQLAARSSSSSRPPSAHGATTSTSARSASSGSTHAGAELLGERALARRDVGERRATRRRRPAPRASAPPTWPSPITAMLRPARSSVPQTRSHVTRIAVSTPSAVHGLGSPEPPRSSASPATWSVCSAITVMSASRRADVLGGDVARRRAGRRVSPKSSSASRRAPASGGGAPAGSMITPLPPPSGSPATADLDVIARDSRSASRRRARESS